MAPREDDPLDVTPPQLLDLGEEEDDLGEEEDDLREEEDDLRETRGTMASTTRWVS